MLSKNLIEFSLDISVTMSTLNGFDGRIPFLLHFERYPVYGKGHKVGHCHQLCLLVVHFLSSVHLSKP